MRLKRGLLKYTIYGTLFILHNNFFMSCKTTYAISISDDRTDSPVLNLSKMNDFRMGGYAADFGHRAERSMSVRENSLDIGRDVDSHRSDERRYNDDDDIVSDEDLDDNKSVVGGNGHNEASSDKDRANNNKKDDDDVDDVDDVS